MQIESPHRPAAEQPKPAPVATAAAHEPQPDSEFPAMPSGGVAASAADEPPPETPPIPESEPEIPVAEPPSASRVDTTGIFATAVAAYEAGQLGEAERVAALVLASNPAHFDAWRLIAIARYRQGRCEQALASYDKALALHPDDAETLSNRGSVLKDLGRSDEALASYERAITAEPNSVDAYYNRAVLLNEQNRFEEALENYDNVVGRAPDYAVALNNRGNVLMRLARFPEALASFDRALAIRSDYAEALNNRGVVLHKLKMFDEALASYARATEIKPDYAEAYNNLGIILKELHRFDEALASHRRAHTLVPDLAEAHWNEALLRLRIGDFTVGWEQFEWRWKVASFRAQRRDFKQPLWNGSESLYDRTILVHAEQGFGDTINLCRFIPMVAARGARVILEVPQPLRQLMESLDGVAQIIATGETPPAFDLHCPIMSLPRAFGTTTANIPSAVPYLRAPAEQQIAWNARFESMKRPRIGLVWAGNPNQENDHNRSMPLAALGRLTKLDATFVSLQRDLRPGDESALEERGILNLGPLLADFSETAAAVVCLDLVVSVDTSVAHLAGALAKPVFVPLTFTPDWRWPMKGDESPWYPTARAFRQSTPGGWDEVVERLVAAVSNRLGVKAVPSALPPQRPPEEVFRHAMAAYQQGQLAEAEALCRATLEAKSDHFDALRLMGVVQFGCKLFAEALASYDAALALQPDHAETLSNRANALKELGRAKEALESYDRALVIAPEFADALYNRGVVLKALGRTDEALAAYDAALAIRPRHAETLNNRGNALKERGRLDEALASYDAALAVRPSYPEALNNRGGTLTALKRLEEAIESYDRALAIVPDYADALYNRGVALKEARRLSEALASFDAALAARPDDPNALATRGNVLKELQRPDEALESYERARAIAPDHVGAFAGVADCAIKLCDWERQTALSEEVFARVRAGEPVMFPLVMIGYADDAALQLACAQNFIRDRIPTLPAPLCRAETWRNDRIRLAYMSADFHEHPVTQLMVELLERHDRKHFETIGISLAPDDGSELHARVVRAFDRFHDVREMSDGDAARLIHGLQPDILIDLNGYTIGCRPEILAHRPAPVQASYLGFPATVGAEYIDYVIADPVIVPFDQASFYTEKIVHLPDTYQPNASNREIAATPSRREAGLPDQGFVFCCFNNHLKITAPVFAIWMRLLAAIEGSVLWLSEFNGAAAFNLMRNASARGVDPTRLIFAPRTKHLADHLARLRLAGLFLDTLPYNAHTTASDALWAGVPVVSCRGNTFAARVAASVLEAVGLPDLVTTSLSDYEALAMWLATDPSLLASVKERLDANRLTYPLFNGKRFARNIEAAFTTMWGIAQRGERPQSFAVEPNLEDNWRFSRRIAQ